MKNPDLQKISDFHLKLKLSPSHPQCVGWRVDFCGAVFPTREFKVFISDTFFVRCVFLEILRCVRIKNSTCKKPWSTLECSEIP